MRGLEENIWKVLAPISTARSTAVQLPPVVLRWTPMRRDLLISVITSRLPYKKLERILNLPVYHHFVCSFNSWRSDECTAKL